jgi:hypothetical protein
MRKTTNRIQEAYMLAKAYYETLDDRYKGLMRKYIADNHIKNDNGTIPECHWNIDDDAAFAAADAAITKMAEDDDNLLDTKEKAHEILCAAEEALIAFVLSIPAFIFLPKEREILAKGAKYLKWRGKILDLAMRLDASTIPARR